MFESFTPVPALIGGGIIGASASLMLLAHGRVTGISGIVGGLLTPKPGDTSWRLWFLAGLLAAGVAGALLAPQAFTFAIDRSLVAVGVAGLLVGFGTRLGNGCTSGHGVCGISRLSTRSIAATLVFIATGGLTVFVIEHVLGGAR